MELLIDKLKKIEALARSGIGGEKETAQRMLDALCEKHGITLDQIISPEKKPYRFAVKDSLDSISSPRTSGSLPASQADSAFEGTGSQLAPVLCPPDPLLSDKPGFECETCGTYFETLEGLSYHYDHSEDH